MIRHLADRVRAALALIGPLGAGSRVLLLRLIGRFGWKTVLAGAVFAVFALFRYRTAIGWILAAWCAAAWMHAPKEPDEERGEATAEPVADPLPAVLWQLIGDAPGVHLKTVAGHLHAAAPEEGIDRASVRAALAARGIPIRASVRGADGRVNEGVHRADLEAWQQALPAPSTPPLSKTRSSPVATPLTSDVATPPTGVATPPTPAE
ncbi:hypothetical protein SGLAM104S_01616 [Streptomyces glaucescens]